MLGMNHPDDLKKINFDFKMLDRVTEMALELSPLLAKANAESHFSPTKAIRDQAFTHLKNAVDSLYLFGQHLNWKNEERRRGYASAYLRRIRNKQAQAAKKVVKPPLYPAGTAPHPV